MARQLIDIGIQGNDGTGDSIRESFRKVNDNFQQLFSLFGEGDTISLTQLDDTPDVYQPSDVDRISLLVADETGTNLVSKVLVGGDNLIIDNSDPNQITIIGGGGELIADENPTLGTHLNANNFNIGNICNPEQAVVEFNNIFNSGLQVTTADNFAVSKGYADRRYLQANSKRAGTIGNQVRVREQPLDRSEYAVIIDDWVGGFALIGSLPADSPPGHGYNTSVNGSGFIYSHEGILPAAGLIKGTTYYIRYVDNLRLAIYENRQDAIDDINLQLYILVNAPPNIDEEDGPVTIEQRGEEKIIDEYYDELLAGNWVGNEALPRSATVRRQGDNMEGPLSLYDHPGSFSGVGTPNGDDDLQAATKLYVDQSSFASNVNLFVATSGNDTQPNVPVEKQGRALSYAFGSIYKACERAEELVQESLTEPGPYRQPITYLSGALPASVTSSDVISTSKRTLKLFSNGAGVDPSKDPNNRDLRDGSIIKGLSSGATAKVISYLPAFNAAADGDNDEFVVELLHTITDPNNFQSSYIISANLITLNRLFIIEQTVLFLNDFNPTLAQQDYDQAGYERDIEFVLDALTRDIKFGGNKETLEISKTYIKGGFLSLTSDQLTNNTAVLNYLGQLVNAIVQNDTIGAATTPPSFGFRNGGTVTQTVLSTDGEQGTTNLVDRLINVVIDILQSPDGQGTGILLDFQIGEELEYGQAVPEVQIAILIETGVYYEQMPMRVPTNVSIIGDEFRRVLIRPALGESQSKWNNIYFYRDTEFDGLRRSYTANNAVSSLLGQDNIITVNSTEGFEAGMYLKILSVGTGALAAGTRIKEVIDSTRLIINIAPTSVLSNAELQALNTGGLAPENLNFGYHYLTDPSTASSRPKENKDMDIFLMNDATMLRNISCQQHGGFMCVLDPEGQIQTKSPYIQTASSVCASLNRQRFAGGMYIDGSAGNLPAKIVSKTNNFSLLVNGLSIRMPQVPTSFFVSGKRYQVNEVEPTSNPGEALIKIDSSSNNSLGFEQNPGVNGINIIFETAGNRSMLANDYTQINDLGYGVIANNNAISELVSVFTYYCYTSYYSLNGGQIRSAQGNSSYGQFGLKAAGRDLTEVPDPVVLSDNTLQVARIYKTGSLVGKGIQGELSVYIDNYQFVPYNISEIEIDFSNTRSFISENSADFPDNIVLTNAGVNYVANALIKPVGGITFGNQTFTAIRVKTVNAGGSITSWELELPGDYSTSPITVNQQGIVNTEQHPGNTVAFSTINGPSSGAQFRVTYLGIKSTYEVNSVEQTTVAGSGFNSSGTPIPLPVLKINLQSSGNVTLLADTTHQSFVTIRGLQNFKFDGVAETKPVRPSTALEFTEPSEAGFVYRTLSYNLTNSIGTALNANQAVLSFDSSYDYVIIQTNPAKLTDTDYVDAGVKTMGSRVGDTRIAVIDVDQRDIVRLNSGNMILTWNGKLFRIAAYVAESGLQSEYIRLVDVPISQGSLVAGSGLTTPLLPVQQTVLRAGIDAGSTAEITVRISTCRASGHDFLDVGTGGFVTSNYPNNLYGAPAIPKQQNKEVVEETQGRVFYASTDQDGVFRIGRFFTVDQGTGTVTFAASIALSNLDGIGFKRGTVVKEFSTDDTMIDGATDAVPTESAVVGYISKRLGITPTGAVVPNNERIPANSGFISVTGDIPMTGNLNMGTPSNRIINLATPSADEDAATKRYVDDEVAKYDELSELTDVALTLVAANEVLIYNGTDWVNSLVTNNSVDATAAIVQSKLSLTAASTRANATAITQADLGVASFDSANFETTNGWVGIKAGGISYSEIQNVTANRILGNLSGSAAAPQELTPSNVLIAGIDTTNIESGATVLTARRNRLNLGAVTSFVGTAVSGSFTYNNVPATSTTGTGSGARFNITRTAGVYTAVSVVYGGNGYANGNILTVNGALLGGESGINNINITVQTANIDSTTILGIQNVSVAAEANSIVSTDSSKNLGTIGNRFNTIYATDLSASSDIDSVNIYVDQLVKSGVDANVTATGPGQASAYQISRSITVVNTQGTDTGVKLPNGTAGGGTRMLVRNSTGLSLSVYPNSGAQINTQGNNVPYPVDPQSALEFFSVGTDQWYTLSATLS